MVARGGAMKRIHRSLGHGPGKFGRSNVKMDLGVDDATKRIVALLTDDAAEAMGVDHGKRWIEEKLTLDAGAAHAVAAEFEQNDFAIDCLLRRQRRTGQIAENTATIHDIADFAGCRVHRDGDSMLAAVIEKREKQALRDVLMLKRKRKGNLAVSFVEAALIEGL